MKWIKIRDGRHKLVEDTDSRPAVKLPNKPLGAPFIPYSPSWRRHEPEMWSQDTKKSMSATDKFIAEREHETKVDPKAAKWEKSRREHWDKQKPAWRKWATRRGII